MTIRTMIITLHKVVRKLEKVDKASPYLPSTLHESKEPFMPVELHQLVEAAVGLLEHLSKQIE